MSQDEKRHNANRLSPNWSKADDERLLELIASRPVLSASEIGRRFSPAKTRNAIIGRCHRLKIKLPIPASKKVRIYSRRDLPPDAPRKPRNASLITLAKSAHPLTLPAPLPFQIDGKHVVTILHLSDHTCKWPIGNPRDPNFCFCGHEPMNGSPYCAYHVQIGTQLREKKSAAARAMA